MCDCSGGNESCLTGRSEQRAQAPINAHKVHECRDVSSLPLRLAQPGAGRGCAVLPPPTRHQSNPVQEPAGPSLPPLSPRAGPTMAGPALLSPWGQSGTESAVGTQPSHGGQSPGCHLPPERCRGTGQHALGGTHRPREGHRPRLSTEFPS